MGAVQGSAVKFDVIMDMFLVDVSGYDKLMFAAGKFQSQLVAQLVGLLRLLKQVFQFLLVLS